MDKKNESRESLTRTFDTPQGVLTYAQLADTIAPNLLALLDDVADGKYTSNPYDETLILEFHKRIVGKVLPEIAGKWRKKDVRVGNHIPTEYFKIPMKMREYTENVRTRLLHANTTEHQIELLAYAEGEFLHIHPFADFNGRTIRALLTELLSRVELPSIDTSVKRSTKHFRDYQDALAEYDNGRMNALVGFWVKRFADTSVSSER
jgi:fido (protein-threonine AMPylation protein)